MGPIGKSWRLAVGVIVLVGIIFGLIFIPGAISIATAPFRGEVAKNEQVEASGEYRVAQHDYFYNLCGDIQAKQQNIALLEEAGEDDAVVANEMQLNELVSEYNSKASNSYTAGQFKADELPYQIDADQEVTSCGKP